jgi:hypothetical protein
MRKRQRRRSVTPIFAAARQRRPDLSEMLLCGRDEGIIDAHRRTFESGALSYLDRCAIATGSEGLARRIELV